jgi:DNA polymerase-3 subunit epsilon
MHEETDVDKIRFVVFDTETTGLNINKDRILSIGSIAVFKNSIKVVDRFECYINQRIYNSESAKIHGILQDGLDEKIEEKEAIIEFLKYIKNAVLVAHHAAFDLAMINGALKRLGLPKLKNKVLDTGHLYNKTGLNKSVKTHFSLDELSNRFNIPQHDRHTASGDAYITALLFLKMVSLLKLKKNITLKDIQSPVKRIGLL